MRTHNPVRRDRELRFVVTVGHLGQGADGKTNGVILTNMRGRNWVQSLTLRQQIDQIVGECEMTVFREEYEMSLAPLMGNSPINEVDSPMAIGHMLFIDVVEGGVVHEIFRGHISEVDWSGPSIRVWARDLAGSLQDRWSEYARWYAIGRIPYGVRMWEAGAEMVAGEYLGPDKKAASGATVVYEVLTGGTLWDTPPEPWPTDYNAFWNGGVQLRRYAVPDTTWQGTHYYYWGDVVESIDGTVHAICVSAGTSSDTEPSWPLVGQCVDDLTVRWAVLPEDADGGISLEAVMDAVIKDNYSGAPEMYTPISSGYWKNPSILQESSVLEALRTYANEIGWDLRLAYVSTVSPHVITPGTDDGWGQWRLQLVQPARTKAVGDYSVTADDVYSVERCTSSVGTIRNVVRIAYNDYDTLGFDGATQMRRYVKVEDAASIAKYDRRYFGISCGYANSISTKDEAEDLANAVLSDLKDPGIEWSVRMPFRWWVELNDLVEFPSTGKFPQFNSQQLLAVVGITHEIRVSGNNLVAHTTVETRGKPTAGIKIWHAKGQGPRTGQPGYGAPPPGPGDVTVSSALKGATLYFDQPIVPTAPSGYGAPSSGQPTEAQLFLSPTQGFTPSPSTLAAVSSQNRFDLTDLEPGTTLYGRVYLKDSMGVISAPSPEFSFTPTQAALADIDDSLKVACAVCLDVGAPGYLDLGIFASIAFNNVLFNDGSAWNNTSHIWTAPVAGVFSFYCRVDVENISAVPDPVTFDEWGEVINSRNFYLGLEHARGGASFRYSGVEHRVRPGDEQAVDVKITLLCEAGDTVTPQICWDETGNTDDARLWGSLGSVFEAARVWSR